MKPNLYTSFNKALNVIESSENSIHLLAAKKFSNNFLKTFSTPSRNNFGRFKTIEANSQVSAMYETLLKAVKEKEKKFSN